MPIVTKYGRGFKDPATITLPPAAYAEGQVRVITTGGIAVANGDNSGSKHYLGKISSKAIILPQSILYHTALTGVTSYDIGLEKDGAVINVNVLASALTLASAGSKSVVAALATGSIGKRVWELLGLSNDPAVEYDIVGKMNADASAAGSLEAFIFYAKK